jgi:DNA-binding transcriptional regulator YhcF (GntR family)
MNIQYFIDPSSGAPAYKQLKQQICSFIAAGALKHGDQLPSIREMAKAAKINPGTVSKAYSQLAYEGVLVLEHGRGVFINATPDEQATPTANEIAGAAIARAVLEARRTGLSDEQIKELLDEELNRPL